MSRETPMENTPFVLEELRSVYCSLGESRRELLALRQSVHKKLAENVEAARPYHALLLQAKQRLVDTLEKAWAALTELGENQLAQGACTLRDAVAAFPVMAKDYRPLMQALEQFCGLLPRGNEIRRALGRMMNQVKMGYYPTDLHHVELMRQALAFPADTPVNLLDPCCGEGFAAHCLAQAFPKCRAYGVELDEYRAGEADARLYRVALGNFFNARISCGAFHLVFLNPPYLTVPSEQGRTREEKRFLIESLPYLMEGGVLFYILPFYRLTPDIARCLCDNFTKLSVYKFEEKEFRRFRQIVIAGVKSPRHDGRQEAKALCAQVEKMDTVPELSQIPSEFYALPNTASEVTQFYGEIFNEAELYRMLASHSLQELYSSSESKLALDSAEKRPLLPLGAGQVGLIGGSGLLDGLVTCDAPHVIKGTVTKETYTDEQVLETRKDGSTKKLLQTDTVTNKLTFHVLTPHGYKRLN